MTLSEALFIASAAILAALALELGWEWRRGSPLMEPDRLYPAMQALAALAVALAWVAAMISR